MVFNSIAFLIFFAVFYFMYWALNNKSTIFFRNAFILIASYVFYGWWDARFLGLIALSSLIDYAVGLGLSKNETLSKRKFLLALSLVSNLGMLAVFKYYHFFMESFQDFMAIFSVEVSESTLNIVLPVGISFYTFQTMSYTIDVYRKQLEPTRNFVTFFAFVSFFPQLVAGPIERASHLLAQFQDRKIFSYDMSVLGMRLVLWGFFKKLVLADNFGALADLIFNTEGELGGWSILAGTLFFAIQIYADFSGYSDIAIGLSKMLGFDLMTNFQTPYFARSFTDFWRRWHISLSTWFRDYVYIPLGGNQGSSVRLYRNIFITFLLSGLWHGANWTFIVWGALHGGILVFEKKFVSSKPSQLYSLLIWPLLILFWLPFRAVDMSHLKQYASALIQFSSDSFQALEHTLNTFSFPRFFVLSLVTFLFFLAEFSFKKESFQTWLAQQNKLQRWAMYYCLFLVLFLLGNFSVKPNFIYFQF